MDGGDNHAVSDLILNNAEMGDDHIIPDFVVDGCVNHSDDNSTVSDFVMDNNGDDELPSDEESFVFDLGSVSDSNTWSENDSDLGDVDFIEQDSLDIDFKVNNVSVINNVKWMNYQFKETLCATQHYYSDAILKLCSHCFFNTFRHVEENVSPLHHSEHLSADVYNIFNYLFHCTSCGDRLFTYCLTTHCILCK